MPVIWRLSMHISTLLYWVFGCVILAITIWIGTSYYVIWDIEEPKYSIIRQADQYEIRKYEPYLIAETDMQTANKTFPVLAKYIFGENAAKESIKMTAPVIMDKEVRSEKIGMTSPVIIKGVDSQKQTMSFVMPSKYQLDTLPKPIDNRIRIKQVQTRTIAVLQYSWTQSDKRFAEKAEKLKALLKADNIKLTSEPYFAGYNPPLTFPLLYRNEVWIDVEMQ